MDQILVLAVLIESVVETLKPIWDSEKREGLKDKLAALAVGLLVALAGGYDLFKALGVPLLAYPALGGYPGIVLTGVLLSRGGTFLHELYALLKAKVAGAQADAAVSHAEAAEIVATTPPPIQ